MQQNAVKAENGKNRHAVKAENEKIRHAVKAENEKNSPCFYIRYTPSRMKKK